MTACCQGTRPLTSPVFFLFMDAFILFRTLFQSFVPGFYSGVYLAQFFSRFNQANGYLAMILFQQDRDAFSELVYTNG